MHFSVAFLYSGADSVERWSRIKIDVISKYESIQEWPLMVETSIDITSPRGRGNRIGEIHSILCTYRTCLAKAALQVRKCWGERGGAQAS